MAHFQIVALLAFCYQVFSLTSPIPAYNIVIPEWEVEVTPGDPLVTLNGTVQDVIKEAIKLNPDFSLTYLNATNASNSSRRGMLGKRAWFDREIVNCNNNPHGWEPCFEEYIREGIDYLARIKGQPTNGPGPGNCGRVSCSYDSAIWWCNDNSKSKTLRAFREIGDGARKVLQTCPGEKLRFGKRVVWGQAFHYENWNVIVRKDSC